MPRPPSSGKENNPSTRPRKKSRSASEKIEISELQLMEMLSVISELFCSGVNKQNQVKEHLKDQFPQLADNLFRKYNFWELVRLASQYGMFHHGPLTGSADVPLLLARTPWLRHRLTAVQTASQEVLATVAAQRLVEMIRKVPQSGEHQDEVHVGFAGGRTLSLIAERLALLLNDVHPDDPSTLVFHAMVAGFDEDDFDLDPNSFINCFLKLDSPIKIRFVRLPMPGIVKNDEYEQLRRVPSISRVLESANDIQIVVTSGSLLGDQSSMLAAFFEHLLQSGREDEVQALQMAYRAAEVVGDLLWQPVGPHGPVEIEKTPCRVATLMPLAQLKQFIHDNPERRVLLVLGRSGVSGMPKSNLLNAFIQFPDQLFTDLVVDTPTLRGCFDSQILSLYQRDATIGPE